MYRYKNSMCINNIYIKSTAIFICLFLLCTSVLQANDLNDHQAAADELKNKDYHKSNYYYLKILSRQPDNIDALTGLAHGFQMQGRDDRALTEINKLLDIDPHNERGLILRAFSNSQKQDWDIVLDDMQLLKKINPLNKSAYMYMDTAYSALGNKEAAASAKEKYEQLEASAAVSIQEE